MFSYTLENALENIFKCLACMKKKNLHNTKFKLAKRKNIFKCLACMKKKNHLNTKFKLASGHQVGCDCPGDGWDSLGRWVG